MDKGLFETVRQTEMSSHVSSLREGNRSEISYPSERHAIGTVPSNDRDKLEKRRTTAILRNDWRRSAMALADRGNAWPQRMKK
jgi:hypothetical protein